MIAPARLAAALPPRAAIALALARGHDRSCDADAADAWIAHATHPHATADRLSGYLRSQSRRNRRAGGAHGPARFTSIDDALDLGLTAPSDDPADLIEAAQQVGCRPGLAAALSEREGAADARALAQREGITLRRAQQILRARIDLASRQNRLFVFEGEEGAK